MLHIIEEQNSALRRLARIRGLSGYILGLDTCYAMAILCYIMLCYTMLYYAMAVLCYIMLWLYYAVLCYAILCYGYTMLYYAMLYYAILCYAIIIVLCDCPPFFTILRT
jgi:hypothetical protein